MNQTQSIKEIIESNLEGKELSDCEVWNDVASMLKDAGCNTDLDIVAETSMACGLSTALATVTNCLYTSGQLMDDEFGDILVGFAADIMDILERLDTAIDDRVADIVSTDGDDE